MNTPPTKAISTTKPPCRREDALLVLHRLREQGHIAYFAGGCVRDLVMGHLPKDWDVATDAPPARVRALFKNTQAVGAAFGVILVHLGPSTIEVATFRTEGLYTDGRRPDSVRFATAAEDAQRRDFTINGLFLDPEKRIASSEKRASEQSQTEGPHGGESACPVLTAAGEDFFDAPASTSNQPSPLLIPTEHGTILDYVGGVADLLSHTLRAIGDADARFAEDHLRLLRAVRFAARFGLKIEEKTALAIRTHALKLRGISPERIADELRLMLTPPTRAAAWKMLWDFGLIDVIMRFLHGHEQKGPDQTQLFLHFSPGHPITLGQALAAAVIDYRLRPSRAHPSSPDSPDSRLASLLARTEIQKLTRAMREALKLSNDELEEMFNTLEPLPQLLSDEPLTIARQKRFLARPTSTGTRLLLTALASSGLRTDRIQSLSTLFQSLEKSTSPIAPNPLITGDDLQAIGLSPGPAFKRILDQVYDAQLEDQVTTQTQALELARQIHDAG